MQPAAASRRTAALGLGSARFKSLAMERPCWGKCCYERVCEEESINKEKAVTKEGSGLVVHLIPLYHIMA